jgi:hypothetical protein
MYEYKKADIVLSFIIAVGLLGSIVGISAMEKVWTNNTNDKYIYENGKLTFTESKCLFGSIFNKDDISLSDDNVEIITRSFFNNTKTVYQYSAFKEVFLTSAFNGYKIVLKLPGNIFGTKDITLYFNQKDTFDLLKVMFKDYCKNRCVIKESL